MKVLGKIHAIWTFGFHARQWLRMQEVLLLGNGVLVVLRV